MLKSKKDRFIAIFTTLFVAIASGLEALHKIDKVGEWCIDASEKVVSLSLPDTVKNLLLIGLIVIVICMPIPTLIVFMKKNYKQIMEAHTTDEYKACLDERKEWKPIKLVYDTFAPTIKKVIRCFQTTVNKICHGFFAIRSFLFGIIKFCFNYTFELLRFIAAEAQKCTVSLTHAIYGLHVVQNVKRIVFDVITKAVLFCRVKRFYGTFLTPKYVIAYKHFLIWRYYFCVAKKKTQKVILSIRKHFRPTK